MARRKLHRKIYRKHPSLVLFLKISGSGFLLLVLLIFAAFLYFAKDLPRPEVFTERPFILPTEIYDREGKVLLYQIYDEEKRTVVSLDQIPDYLKQSVITAEDANFYRHFGLDAAGIIRSVLKDVGAGKLTYGGSTVSQQLIRSSFLTPEKTFQRKIKEIILTLELERRYSKDQILEFYLNQVPFGLNAYGAEAAAQTYFGKSVSGVSLSEAATLAALIRAPSYLSRIENREKLISIKNYILGRMAVKGYISKEEARAAQNEALKFAEIRHPIKAPHFVLFVKNYLEENYSNYLLRTGGLKVYTSIDWQLQELAEKTVEEGVAANKFYNAHNAALVAINPNNGEILAMVGSANYFGESYPEGCVPGSQENGCLFDPQVNVAAYGEGRQPGSSFKPFAYYLALQEGLAPETVLWDVKTEFNPDCAPDASQEKDQYGLDCYHPKNYDGRFRGPITLRQALAQSINIPSIKILYMVGVKETISLAKSLGISTLNQPSFFYGLSLVLGGGEVRLLDLVSAYGSFATRGLNTPPVSILKIEDSKGNVIEENKKSPKRVLDPKTTNTLNNILSDNDARFPVFSRSSPLSIPGYQIAAKTGTTQEFKDGWTIGYTPSLVAGVWVGNNDGTLMNKEPGVVLAGPIWHNFMENALKKYPPENFVAPEPSQAKFSTSTHTVLPEIDPQYQNWEWSIQNWLNPTTSSTPAGSE